MAAHWLGAQMETKDGVTGEHAQDYTCHVYTRCIGVCFFSRSPHLHRRGQDVDAIGSRMSTARER